MKIIDRLLPAAEAALKRSHIVNNDGIVEEGVMEGYIASFGASVINLDLLSTLAVYKADEKKRKVLDALAYTLGQYEDGNDLFIKAKELNNEQMSARRLLKEKVVNASIALKMVIRTFEIRKSNG